MFNIKKKLGAVALLALFTMGSASAAVLDTFDYDTQINLAVSPSSTSDFTTRLDINDEFADVDYTLNLISGSAASSNSINVGSGTLKWSNSESDPDFGEGLSSLNLKYGESDGLDNGLNYIDLTENGLMNAFYFDVFAADSGFTIEVTVFDIFGGISQYVEPSTEINSPERVTLSFANFVDILSGGANFTRVGVVNVLLTSTISAVDLTVTEFGTIPEPGTLAIFGLALVGLAFGSRKKA